MGNFYMEIDGAEYSDVEEFLDYFYTPAALYESRGANSAEDFMDRHGKSKFFHLDYILQSVEPDYLNLDSHNSHRLLEFAMLILDDDSSFRIFRSMDAKHQRAIYDFRLNITPTDFCFILNLYKMTDYPPLMCDMYQTRTEVEAILKSYDLSCTTGNLNRISAFTLQQSKHAMAWNMGLWFLVFKYGYDLVDQVLTRVMSEDFKTDPLSFARIVHNYIDLENYPLDWILDVSENPLEDKSLKKAEF